MAEEVLSRALGVVQQAGQLVPMTFVCGVPIPTHILYVDDILIFWIGTKKNVRCLLPIFASYSEVSGQVVNAAKSQFFTGSMTQSRFHVIANLLGFSHGFLPFQYLGCPIFKGNLGVLISILLLTVSKSS